MTIPEFIHCIVIYFCCECIFMHKSECILDINCLRHLMKQVLQVLLSWLHLQTNDALGLTCARMPVQIQPECLLRLITLARSSMCWSISSPAIRSWSSRRGASRSAPTGNPHVRGEQSGTSMLTASRCSQTPGMLWQTSTGACSILVCRS